jgi:Zn-dependent peptidase ImmA (M78 family)
MKLVPDKTKRFGLRPHYERRELDILCDKHITDFLLERHEGIIDMPIKTEDLEVLIEQETSDYDPYANLSKEGDGIEGMTVFVPRQKPRVYISKNLGDHYSRENRRRTTIAHELGHVRIHAPLWSQLTDTAVKCNRDGIDGNYQYDWLEWQAYYASGAYLLPISQVQLLLNEILDLGYRSGPFYVSSSPGHGLIVRAMRTFRVSKAAVKVRLTQLGIITEKVSEATVT